jgi:hypothetical protein
MGRRMSRCGCGCRAADADVALRMRIPLCADDPVG